MLEFVHGDMFEAPADIRVNTVNCVGVMGAGVALAFKQRYPEMFRDYQRDCKNGRIRPGELHVWRSLDGDWVINFPTKRDWRDPSRYEDIDSGLDALRAYIDPLGPVTIAVPALGCGHGGLDWERVSGMIRKKLDGVDAHVRIYAPADSREAGRSVSHEPTDDELKSVERLGYTRMGANVGEALETSAVLFAKGKPDVLTRRWIALLPSRTPGERELQALQSIASELACRSADTAVALVHGSRASEEIADIFAGAGIHAILLLPFGVLTRKPLAKRAPPEREILVHLASIAPASAKWSRILFAQTMDLLRARAASLLLSDPEPEWLTGRGLAKWDGIPIAYVRYEGAPEQLRHALSAAGATAIGRRGESGAPNLDSLFSEGRAKVLPSKEARDQPRPTGRPDSPLPPNPVAHEQPLVFTSEPSVVTIDLSDYPDSVRRQIVSWVLAAVPERLTLEAILSDPSKADALRRYIGAVRTPQIE